MRLPEGTPTKLITSKFDLVPLDSTLISVLCFAVLMLLWVTFIFRNFKNCDVISTYEGAQEDSAQSGHYMLTLIHSPKAKQTFSTFFIELFGNSYDTSSYNIRSEILCQWNHAPSALVRKDIYEAKIGKNRIYSTGLFNYDSVLMQTWITGNLSKCPKMAVTVTHTSTDFFKQMNNIKNIFSKIAFSAVILYVAAYFISTKKKQRSIEHILVLVSLISSVFGTNSTLLKDLFSEKKWFYIWNLITNGFYQSTNLIILYCLIIRAVSSNSILTSLILSSIFVISESISGLTQDSAILSTYFDNNEALYVFFLSISYVAKAMMLGFGLYKLIDSVATNIEYKRTAIYFLIALVVYNIIGIVSMNFYYFIYGYGSSILDFNAHFITPFVTSLALADIYWPTPMSKDLRVRPALQDVLATK